MTRLAALLTLLSLSLSGCATGIHTRYMSDDVYVIATENGVVLVENHYSKGWTISDRASFGDNSLHVSTTKDHMTIDTSNTKD